MVLSNDIKLLQVIFRALCLSGAFGKARPSFLSNSFEEGVAEYSVRLCIVEAEVKGWTKLVASCVYPVEKNIIVKLC